MKDDLYSAIGRVVLASGELENRVRNLLSDFLIADEAWILFEGQDLGWLTDSCMAIMSEEVSNYYSSAGADQLRGLLREVHPLREMRNTVVHGLWREDCILDGDGCKPRPFGGLDEEDRTFHVIRSRRRKVNSDQRWSIDDVEKLADLIGDLVDRLYNLQSRRGYLK
jgi:hypothetical protein